MKFGPVAIEKAAGAILAHSQKLAAGKRIRKGKRLDAGDLAALSAAGFAEVVVARLEPGDAGEDEAATLLAAAIAGPDIRGIRAEAAATGRANLFAEHAGLFVADAEKVARINRADPGITFATLDHLRPVEAGRMVATVKIIPYAVARSAVEAACRHADGAIGVERFQPHRVGVVATMLPALKPSVMDKTLDILAGRLAASGSSIEGELRVAHEAGAVAEAIRELAPQCDMLIVFGASAISDIDDVIPAAIREAGGRIEHFGMPVDPGNLLLVGELDGKPVLGAPGCARSPAENGFDWVLQQTACRPPRQRRGDHRNGRRRVADGNRHKAAAAREDAGAAENRRAHPCGRSIAAHGRQQVAGDAGRQAAGVAMSRKPPPPAASQRRW